ncbi:MAG: YbgA family protein [Thermodesulfobacteriota bacterium]
MADRIRVGISACLLGQTVRYDGGHKLDRYIRDTLGKYLEFVPVCPEVECGLGVPREAMRLVGDPESPRLVTVRSGRDVTEQMLKWAKQRLEELQEEELCGFIFKSGSPSSGMERVKVYSPGGMPSLKGRGLFAGAFMERFPLLPVEEDGRLHDPKLRENFVERIFVMWRWRKVRKAQNPIAALVDFHTSHKFLILAHSPKHAKEMGKLVADAGVFPPSQALESYEALLMQAMRLLATTPKHLNVLQHMLGYFKKQLSADEKQEMMELLFSFREGHLPLVVPVTLLKHYVRKYGVSYLAQQTYLEPHPLELQLRNHV